MTSPRFDFLQVGRAFVDLNRVPALPAILAIFLGGSNLYSAKGNPENHHADWDGVIVVRTKLDIFTLVNQRRRDLLALLGIATEEMPEFSVPEPSSPLWDEFDALRIAGFTETHSKRSVKVLSLEYFWGPKSTLNILSYKDKRVYPADDLGTAKISRVQQATRLPSGLLVLHDQLVYQSPPTACVHGHKSSSASFGVTADLIVSGTCLFGNLSYGRQIKSRILSSYSAATQRHATIQSFARHTRFSTDFIDWLSKELSDLNRLDPLTLPRPSCVCPCFPKNASFLYGTTNTTHELVVQDFSERAKRVPLVVFHLVQQGLFQSHQRPHSVFSSNSSTYEVLVPAVEGDETKLFAKQSRHQLQEISGATTAAIYYPRIHIPRLTSSGNLLYPFFDGITEAELRMSFIHGGRSHWPSLELLLYTEMVKAEDTLRAYRTCLGGMEGKKQTVPPNEGIQRFLRSRVADDARFTEFYRDGFYISGKSIPMEKFLALPWKVNGAVYPSLRTLFRNALEVLHPQSTQMQTCPIAFGLGDAHGANVMISPSSSPDNSREIIYLDHEVAGFHAILLDLAKPFYNDIFFETLYADILPATEDIAYEIDEKSINVRFTPRVDDVTQAIFEIKTRYLLQPLCEFVLELGGNLERNVTLLSNALLLCATLTRNYGASYPTLFMNMATGIVLSTANDWKEFYSCLRSLGLDS
ncbi:hypothetical protein RB601_001201 [Gaeumannomyces tritici]